MTEERQCAASTKRGTQCKGKALPGSEYCFNPSHQALGKPLKEPITVEVPTEESAICGHINRHSKGIDGKLNYLSCTLPKGHEGNHGAFYFERKLGPSYRDIDNPRKVLHDVEYEKDVWGEWMDMAGTPVEDIHPDPTSIDQSKQPFREKDIGIR